MTYVVTESCIRCKFQDCLQVCPATCFYEGRNMLVINPEQCIDCGACAPECPVEAIIPDTVPEVAKWVEFNRKFSKLWPNIRVQGNVPVDADDWMQVQGKLRDHFVDAPAQR